MDDLTPKPNDSDDKLNDITPPEPPQDDGDDLVIEPKISPVAAGFLGLAGGFVFYQIFGGLISLLIFGLNPKDADVNALRLMNVAGQVLFILLPSVVFAKVIYSNVSYIMRIKLPSLKELGVFSLGMIVLIPLIQNYLYIQNYFIDQLANNYSIVNYLKEMFDSLNKMVDETFGNLLKADSFMDYIIVFTSISITPAICEEAMFRGFIQKSFEMKYRPMLAILITSIFFGLYHFSPYGLLPLIGLGFYIGYAAYKTNSIVVPMILHFMNNFISILFYYLFENIDSLSNTKVSESDFHTGLYNFSYQFIIFVVVIIYIIYGYKKNKFASEEK